MKKIKWINPNRMEFNSPHKSFNRQCRYITTGNHIGDIVISNFIRPFNKTKCNGFKFPKGHLQDFDLKIYNDYGMPYYVGRYIKNNGKSQTFILYWIKHFIKNKRITDAYILTTDKYKHVQTWYINRDWRMQEAVRMLKEYITE